MFPTQSSGYKYTAIEHLNRTPISLSACSSVTGPEEGAMVGRLARELRDVIKRIEVKIIGIRHIHQSLDLRRGDR